MVPKTVSLAIAACLAGALAGCSGAPYSRMPVYDTTQTGQVISEQKGEITAVRDVAIRAPSSHAGAPGTGSQIGSAAVAGVITGSPIAAASAIGSVVGGMAGARVDDRPGEEITITVEGGKSIVVVQERTDPPLAVGERVKILSGSNSSIYGGGSTRVVRDTTY
ncbi:MAG: hypothetical protein EXS39_04645 [Opitutaceae bacterium]|nr:hypothetical protein [Opitutaceae bacterium]